MWICPNRPNANLVTMPGISEFSKIVKISKYHTSLLGRHAGPCVAETFAICCQFVKQFMGDFGFENFPSLQVVWNIGKMGYKGLVLPSVARKYHRNGRVLNSAVPKETRHKWRRCWT